LAIIIISILSNITLLSKRFDDDLNYDIDGTIRDSVCFSLRFFPGDTLYYRIEAQDSIIINFDEALTKKRYERLRVVCDSVSKNGHFHLALTYTDFVAEESRGEIRDVLRQGSPWTNRTVYLTIDSLGVRHRIRPDNPNRAAISPGGAFQSFLFFGFEEHCKAINESWLVKTSDTLFENGVPGAILNHANLMRAEPDIDTLDYECSRFRFIRTATGNVEVITNEEQVITMVVINSGGNLFISKKYKVPVYSFQTAEQKLSFFFPDEKDMKGLHYNNTHFVLEEIIRDMKYR